MTTLSYMNSTLRLDVSINDGIHTVSIAGELDAGSVSELSDCLDGCREPGARVLLDLRQLNFMDAAGLELLDRTYVQSSLEGWTFAVITTGERYLARAAQAILLSITRSNAHATAGSNCVPAQRRNSASARGAGIASRYGRSVVMALNASQTEQMRASMGMASPARPSG